MEWIWLGVVVALILVELVSINFTAIWFVISGIISYILLKCHQDYIIQVLSFLISGILFIVIIRPFVIEKLFKIRDNLIKKITKKHPFFNKLLPLELRTDNNPKNSNKNKHKKNEMKNNKNNKNKNNSKKNNNKNKKGVKKNSKKK